jgi:hypothetical protein
MLNLKPSMLKKIGLLITACIGLFLFVYLFEETFPTASIDLKVSRHEAVETATKYLRGLGYDVSDYHSSVIFSGNRAQFVFLEKSLGLKEANRAAKEDMPIWFWKVRFFKELEKESYEVRVNPIGRIDGFSHQIEYSEPGADITQEKAREHVEKFLEESAISLESLELIESRSSKKEKRTDHSFMWKMPSSELPWQQGMLEGTGMVRVSVTVQGDTIGAFNVFFWTPEVFDRFIDKLFAEGRFLALISSFFYMLLYVAAVIMFIVSFRSSPAPYRIMVALAILIGLPNFLNVLNSLPLLKAGYDTKMNFLVYFGSSLIQQVKGIINQGLVTIIVFCAASYLTLQLYAKRVSALHQVLEGKRIDRSVRNEILGGYVLAFILLGFVTCFYYIGMKYCGVWVFPSPKYSNILGTWFPFLLPLSLSIVAAVSEEFIFRLFAVSFLKRFLRVTFLAVLIPSIIWAFAHSSYAVFPVYTRGIELTIVGLAFCYVFLRYGILNCIIAHYVVDAVLFSLPLLRSTNSYYIFSGFFVIVLALLPILLSSFWKKSESRQKSAGLN